MVVQNAREIDPRLLVFLLPPIAVFIGLEFALKGFGDGSLDIPTDAFSGHPRLTELSGRYNFMGGSMFFGGVMISILIIFAIDLWVNYARRTRIWALIGILFGAGVGIVSIIFAPAWTHDIETYHLVGRSFFEAALGQGQASICAPESACEHGGGLHVFLTVSGWVNSLTAIVSACAVTGMVLALARTPGEEIPDEGGDIVASQEVIQRYLYCAGLLLTAGMIFLNSWLRWPSEMIADDGVRTAYSSMISSISLFIGVAYSMMILSVYLPVMLVHRFRTMGYQAKLAKVPLPESTVMALPEIPQVAYLDAVKSVVAILSPILASAVGSFGQGVLFS